MSTPNTDSLREPTVAALVARALEEPADFDALVIRFQDMAVGTAVAWLRDSQLAQDVAQEAFVEAWTNLRQLREPAAFPGFLRRIVLKHCDRRTRVRRDGLTDESPNSATPPIAPDASMSSEEERVRLRAAIDRLPRHERLVVALHYLAGLSQQETAAWLELPLSTVKKRLHSARSRLRGGLETMINESFEAMRPSRDASFTGTIRLFLAIRLGDSAAVRAVIEQRPELVEAEERWDDETTRAHGLPAPNGGTALVRAAGRGQLDVMRVLLELGADVNRACACAGGESPLWAAVASGQARAAELLLAREADPNAASFAGHAPLHVAAIRGDSEIANLLVAGGADREGLDRAGRTPADWATLKGHAELAERLGVVAAIHSVPPAPDEVPRDAQPVAALETGIKAIDLFAPWVRGARIRMCFGPGDGAIVLLGEISSGFAARAGGPAVVWAGWERRPEDRLEIEAAFDELGLASGAELVWSSADEDAETRRRTPQRAIEAARRLQQREGVTDVLVVLFAGRGRGSEIDAVLPCAEVGPGGSITLLVAERDGQSKDTAGAPAAPWDAEVVFDPALKAAARYPAIHPIYSAAAGAGPGQLGPLADRVRALLARHRAGEAGDETATAERLQAYLTQPFGVTESFTGRLGRAIGSADLARDLARILSGELDAIALPHFLYKSTLDANL